MTLQQLRPNETVLFEGDGTLLKSKLNVKPTGVAVTNQRLMIGEGHQSIERAEIASVSEEKHGFAKKMVFQLRDGKTVSLLAANEKGFRAAALILTGQAGTDAMPVAPKLIDAKNGTAWLAGFGPLIASFIALIVGAVLWGRPEGWGFMQLIQLFILRFVVMWLLMRVDDLTLQKQGYNTKELRLASPFTLPFYLFSRAKVFGQSKAYAITWCVLFGLDFLLAFA